MDSLNMTLQKGLDIYDLAIVVKFKVKSGDGKEENLQCFSNILRR